MSLTDDVRGAVPGWEPNPGEEVVQVIDAPGGGQWAITNQGGVITIGGAPFLGSYLGLPEEDRLGSRQFTGIEQVPGGGYRLVAVDDVTGATQHYQFDPQAPQGPPPSTTPGYDPDAPAVPPPDLPAPPAAPTAPDTSAEDARRDAMGIVLGALQRYGLSGLEGWVEGKVRAGASAYEVLVDLYDTAQFKERFKAIELRRQAGKAPMSPEEVLQFEIAAGGLLRSMGALPGMYDDPDDFVQFLVNDMDITELAERLQGGWAKVTSAPDSVRQAFSDFFGAQGDQALLGLFLDPDRSLPILQQMVASAQVGGVARQFGYAFTRERAEGLAQWGVSFEEAQQGFSAIQSMNPLFRETITERSDLRAEVEGVDAAFQMGGDSAEVIEQRRRQRVAALSGGGGALMTEQGIVGAGFADR